jgi:peptidoglycan DL-endopeptidase CwlO
MIPSRVVAAACLILSLGLLPIHPVEAATKKESSKSGTTKKKTTTSEKAPAGTKGADKTSGATKPLDRPLPAEVGAAGNKSSAAKKPAPDAPAKPERAPSATVEPESMVEFSAQPPRIQQLIRDAIDLARQNLAYTFGSADPEKGGMDCSGTIYYLLRQHGLNDVARDSSGQYLWARQRGTFYPVVSKNAESVEFEQLQPGDLMFWTGTYTTGRDVPISHVMMYLGREKGTKKRIMFGASDGRSYNGVQRWGVSVFDFKMPNGTNGEPSKVEFVGFARIPGLRRAAPTVEETSEKPPEAAAKPTPNPKPAVTASKKKSRKG